MKITDVKAVSLVVPLQEKINAPISIPYADKLAGTVFEGYRTTLVFVETDEGITGVGECMVRLAPTATRAIVENLKPILIGMDPFDYEVIWELMYGAMMNRGHNKGFFIEAISGIDVAIWDIMGKALGKPVYSLLGGKMNDPIRCYASSLRFRGMETTLAEARKHKADGFTAMKIKIGQDPRHPEKDVEVVRAIREEVGPEITLMVDVNCGYDVKTALKVGRQLEDLDIAWFEEPITPDNLPGYELLCRELQIPIACGEAEFTRFNFRELISRGAVDIVQPNVCRAGGFTEIKKIAAIASAWHLSYAPHTGSCSAVCLAASLHVAAALPNFLIHEFMRSDWSRNQPNPLRHHLTVEPVEIYENGHLNAPVKPGLGIEINQDIVERYQVR